MTGEKALHHNNRLREARDSAPMTPPGGAVEPVDLEAIRENAEWLRGEPGIKRVCGNTMLAMADELQALRSRVAELERDNATLLEHECPICGEGKEPK